MPNLTINGTTYQVPVGIRLTQAIEDSDINVCHRCGGNAHCATCRVKFLSGEPTTMTRAEYDLLKEKGMLGEVRLSCQIECDHEMSVQVLMTKESQGWPDSGHPLEDVVTPEAVWYPM